MAFSNKHLLLIFFISVIYALGFNEYNRRVIIHQNPLNFESNSRSLIFNSTIFSVDNEWYLPQIKNLLTGKGFTSNPNKEHYDVRRTPVYPIFYGLHYILFGEKNSFYFIRFTQILLFSLAVVALLLAVFNFTKNKKIALISAFLFGINPTLVSYLYFTITEALSPALVCFLLYFLSRCFISNNKKNWFLTGLFFAIGSLCRPSVFFFAAALLFAFLYINKKSVRSMVINGSMAVLGSGLLFVPHIARNLMLTNGDLIILEKYYGDPMDFGMPNIELRKWISCWMNPADFSSEIISGQMKMAIIDGKESKEETISKQLERLPLRAFLANSKEDITNAYASLYDYYYARFKGNNLAAAETICMNNLQQLKIDFVQKTPLQYYIVTPIFMIKSIVFQSNSPTLAILDNYQASLYKKTLKAFLYLLNVFLFIAMFGSLFFIRKHLLIYGICMLFILINIGYIGFVLKYFEVRYLIPIFPCMYILGAIFFVESVDRFKTINYTSK